MKAGIKDIISLGPHNKPSEINNTHVNMQVGLATESHLKHQPNSYLVGTLHICSQFYHVSS